ncbi:toxin glutamine deamidase domain-containing protein [Micromonospora rifamycinica]|uniref:toxin glutamine deamidase domain-containing protein n=1 Tax=Micromonospora rifamycinica TaxID=291594 RepID=UPI000A068C21|nr:toxin glutamine deamidase domain-containing protein [Micromonospora rifamycinica]
MTVLPSPIPHPLDFSPWDLPGWVYEALDWVVGVEWPEGNERAVWDLADQWYAVAGALTGPRADAVAAATEIRNGYGGAGAVPDAFEAAWRRLADGDEAPLSVLLTVSTDLGRLVEECGCDIEAAKLEVWIELGLLVVELLALAVAAALTAGVASPAAGAAVTASRLVIQQIFRRLTAQLAKKALRQGLREAGERAAKEVARGGMRGLGKRAVQGGLYEAGEEAGVSLATQAYQNSTGRRHGLDLADLGASALGGLAGGAVAPLAGLGRHATGRGARVGEHFGREMTGEVLAEGAAGLATGQGVLSLEEASRAAVSGAAGSATGQADAALHARLDGRLHALADAAPVPTAFPGLSPPVGGDRATPSADAPVQASAGAAAPTPAVRVDPALVTGDGPGTAVEASSPPPQAPTGHGPLVGGPAEVTSEAPAASRPAATDHPTADYPTADHPAADHPAKDHPTAAVPVSVAAASMSSSPTLSSVTTDSATSPVTAGRSTETVTSALVASPGVDAAQVNTAASTTTAGGSPAGTASSPTGDSSSGRVTSAGPVAGVSFGSPPGVPVGPAPTAGPPAHGSATPSVPHLPPAAGAGHPGIDGDGERRGARRFPLLEALAPGPVVAPATEPVVPTPRADDEPPRPRTPQWYAAMWAAEREALDRRRYQGYFEAQRHWFEDRRRRDEAGFRRELAREHEARAQRAARRAESLQRDDRIELANWFQGIARQAQRDANGHRDLAEAILAGRVVPDTVFVADPADFSRINGDVAELAVGGVETGDRSALTGDDSPPPIDRSRRYGRVGGLRPPLALHQTDLERQLPRQPDGSVVRTADPRQGGWFALANDGGPQADPTRGINCLDCTLSLFETWVHGRPRVAAPRTFDGYLQGDIRRPVNGEVDGPGRVEEVTGGRFQKLFAVDEGAPPGPAALRQSVERGYRNLRDQLVLGGHGSYAFLITEWENGGSHAWVALNQNGAVLYLDPQAGTVRDRPLYAHAGRRHPDNVVGIDALILGADARPMPLGGLARGRFSVRPDLPDHPPAPDDEQGYGDPYLNRLHLLDGPGGADHPADAQGDVPPSDPGAEPVEVMAELSVHERGELDKVREQAAMVADEVENTLGRLAARVGGALGVGGAVELRDQEFRLKSPLSLARKFLDEASSVGISVEEFSVEVNDVLRFCFVVSPAVSYEEAVRRILAELNSAGFTVDEGSCKNFWRAGNRFYGFNCTVRCPEGQLFELQVHSRSSRAAWLETHHAYEVLRRTTQSPVRRVEAFLEMLSMNRCYGMPAEVPTRLAESFPAKDASFAKWIHLNRGVWWSYIEVLRADGRDFAGVAARFGLTAQDFPVSPELERQLERQSVDLLRSVP